MACALITLIKGQRLARMMMMVLVMVAHLPLFNLCSDFIFSLSQRFFYLNFNVLFDARPFLIVFSDSKFTHNEPTSYLSTS